MNYYVATGRVTGDDEDTIHILQAESKHDAYGKMIDHLRERWKQIFIDEGVAPDGVVVTGLVECGNTMPRKLIPKED